MQINCFEIFSIPDTHFDAQLFIDSIGAKPFVFIHDGKSDKSYVKFISNDKKSDDIVKNIEACTKGIGLKPTIFGLTENKLKVISFYKGEGSKYGLIKNILSKSSEMPILLLFIPQDQKNISLFKDAIEKELSSRNTHSTRSYTSNIGLWREMRSSQNEIYSDSEEKKMLLSLINDIDKSIITGSQVYKIFMIVPESESILLDILEERSRIFSKDSILINSIEDLIKLSDKPGIIHGSMYAASMVEFLGPYRLNYVIDTFLPKGTGDIVVGTYLKDGTTTTDNSILMPHESLNLGTIISGLPGMGKTTTLMHIINQLIGNEAKIISKPLVAIISPTGEWDDFGYQHNMNVLHLNDNYTQINFFMATKNAVIEKFYQDLALLLSSASNSGPYQGPIEKCMLNAFRQVYFNENAPNPTHVYNCIIESVIKLHGKITNVGIKYTKHGENINASLENLRGILSREEYSSTKSLSIERMLQNGIVFSMDKISNSMRPYMYALILNQLYSIAESFDVFGDNELRLLICIEEAQTIFKSEQKKINAATQDLINRIQNFRKKGVGIVLLVHSITDIDVNIRRLCQNKIYMKQPSDIAPIASRELVFTYSDNDKITNKLKHLDSSIAAFDFVDKNNSSRLSNDSIFIKIAPYVNSNKANQKMMPRKQNSAILSDIHLLDSRTKIQKTITQIRIIYIGEECHSFNIEKLVPIKCQLLDGRYYIAELLSESKRILYRLEIRATKTINIDITDNSAFQLNIIEKNTHMKE